MVLQLDIQTAHALVEAAILDQGEDYVYPNAGTASCQYVEVAYADGEYIATGPSCLVGSALIKGGIDPQWFAPDERNDQGSHDVLNDLYRDGLVEYSQEAEDYFALVQASQDAGATWGDSHKYALKGMQFIRTRRWNEELGVTQLIGYWVGRDASATEPIVLDK